MIVVAVAGLFAVAALPETRGIDLAPIGDPEGADTPSQRLTPDAPPSPISARASRRRVDGASEAWRTLDPAVERHDAGVQRLG
jgi:hypothetical protein